MQAKRIISAVLAMTTALSGAICSPFPVLADNTAVSTNVIGDANCDGEANIADAVLILQSLANPDAYSLTEAGRLNADVYNKGDGVTASDALSIQKLEAGVISELPESVQFTEPDTTKPIYVNSDNVLIVSDYSLFGLTREELSERLGEEIPVPQDFPWYNVAGLENTDYVYNGSKICFMFQYGKLAMIIYDIMNITFDRNIYDSAVSILGEGELSTDMMGTVRGEIQLGDGNFYEILDDYYEETGELCVHQRYVSPYYNTSESFIRVDENGVLLADTSLLGMTREQLSEKLGENIPEPKDFPWWGVNLSNTDYEYKGNKICFMFQTVTEKDSDGNETSTEKLVMIIYDVMDAGFDTKVYGNAVKLLGNGELSPNTDGTMRGVIKFDDGSYYEILEDYYEETGEKCYHQRYVSKDIITDSSADSSNTKPIVVNGDGVFIVDRSLLGLTREELSAKLGEEIPEPQDFPWWGKGLSNTDYVYNNNKICFMFQNGKTVMIIYDVMNKSFDYDVYTNAVKLLGNGTLVTELDGGLHGTIKFDNGDYYEILDDYYEKTGELCVHHRYVSKDYEV